MKKKVLFASLLLQFFIVFCALAQEAQTITFSEIPVQTISCPDLTNGSIINGDYGYIPHTATASSGLPVTYSINYDPAFYLLFGNVAEIIDGAIHIISPGVCIIRAQQAGNADFLPAPVVDQFLIVNVSNTMHLNLPRTMEYGKRYSLGEVLNEPMLWNGEQFSILFFSSFAYFSPVTLQMSSTRQMNYPIVRTEIIDIPPYVPFNDQSLQEAPKDITWGILDNDGKYSAFTYSIGVKGNQNISIYLPPNKKFGDSDFDITSTQAFDYFRNVLRPITYNSSNENIATIINNKIHIVGAGTCSITAHQAGDGFWNPAEVSQTLTILKASQTISFNNLPQKTFGDADFALTATTNSNLAINFTSSNSEVATVENGTVHIVGTGICTIYANQSGNINYYPASQENQQLTVNPREISITALANQKVYGETDPELTFQVSPSLVNGDTFNGTLTRVIGEDVGTYSIQQGSLSAGNNYSIAYNGATFTLSKKELTITAEDKSKDYGSSNPTFSSSYSGFAYSESETVLDAKPAITCSAALNSLSGQYPIEISGGLDNNYALTLVNGNLKVNTILGNVNTTSIQDIANTTAVLNGEVINHGGEENAIRGFVYSAASNPTLVNSSIEAGTGIGVFSNAISGLAPNTKYYIRSYTTNSAGTAYGNELFFTTLSTSVPTQEVSEVTIYPNPTSGIIYFKDINPRSKIEVYNANGAFIQNADLVNNQVNLKNLKGGVYLIKLIFEGKVSTIKIIKE